MKGSMRGIINDRIEPAGLDFYSTPPWATEELCDIARSIGWTETIDAVWEPACGDGAMSKVLKNSFKEVVSTDIVDRGYHDFDGEVDFLMAEMLGNEPKALHKHSFTGKTAIITNPPFSFALQFVTSAFAYTGNVAILARLSWLEGKHRYNSLFRSNPPDEVHVFCQRVGFSKDGEDFHANAGVAAHAWFIWKEDRDAAAPRPILKWIV